MSKFTKEMVTEYADKLLIGLSEDENRMVLDEFEVIDKNIDLINRIPGIEKVDPYSWCLDSEIDFLRDDVASKSTPIKEALSNSDRHTENEIEVPKVVS